MKPAAAKLCGILVALGAVTWAATRLATGIPEEGVNDPIEIWGGAAFLVGVVAMLAVMRATDATGASRWGRIIVNVGFVFVALAMAWNIPFMVDANRPHEGVVVVLDAFWPLSMVWLIVVGVAVVRARRWPTPARWLPLAASMLVPLDVALFWLPEQAAHVFTWTYLATAYTLVGVEIVRSVAPILGDMSPAASAVTNKG